MIPKSQHGDSIVKQEFPSGFGHAFGQSGSYVHHRLTQSRALPQGSGNPICNRKMDAVGEICTLQISDCADDAKEFAQDQLPFFATSGRDSQRTILRVKN
jgi:hypothetical protein